LEEKQSLKFSTKQVVNKTAAIAAQLAKCILLHANLRTTAAPSRSSTNKNFIFIAYLTSWHSSIFGYKLRIYKIR